MEVKGDWIMNIPEKHKKISKYQILKIIAKRTGISEEKVTIVINAYHIAIKEILRSGFKIVMKDFGTYDCRRHRYKITQFFNTDTKQLEKMDKYKYVELYAPYFKFSGKFENEIKRESKVFIDGE